MQLNLRKEMFMNRNCMFYERIGFCCVLFLLLIFVFHFGYAKTHRTDKCVCLKSTTAGSILIDNSGNTWHTSDVLTEGKTYTVTFRMMDNNSKYLDEICKIK